MNQLLSFGVLLRKIEYMKRHGKGLWYKWVRVSRFHTYIPALLFFSIRRKTGVCSVIVVNGFIFSEICLERNQIYWIKKKEMEIECTAHILFSKGLMNLKRWRCIDWRRQDLVIIIINTKWENYWRVSLTSLKHRGWWLWILPTQLSHYPSLFFSFFSHHTAGLFSALST